MQVLAYESQRNADELHYPLTEVRYLPSTFPPSPLVIIIFGEYVVHTVSTDPIYMVRSKNEELATAYRQYFKLLWEQAAD